MDKDMEINIHKERVRYILKFLKACRDLKQFDILGMDVKQVASIADYINMCETSAVNSRDFIYFDIMAKNGCTYEQAKEIFSIIEDDLAGYETDLKPKHDVSIDANIKQELDEFFKPQPKREIPQYIDNDDCF